MKLFIPEIGTELVLTKDWCFKLILENRNKAVIERFYSGYKTEYSYYNYIIEEIYPDSGGLVLRNHTIDEKLSKLYKEYNHLSNDEYKIKLRQVWLDNQLDWIPSHALEPVCLPKGTILKVDRIYIRKGKGMSDYSSITFYAQLPGIKKKMRFFAHLNDVNTIECELKIETNLTGTYTL